ncbi:DUF4445 domain-containing protein [Methylococcaceae bacterium WWC4]|nr:DUF4445 domain-containing protein [Methylococcaceae bacterium WWC4]
MAIYWRAVLADQSLETPPVWPVTIASADQRLTLALTGDISVRKALDATGLRVRAACGGLGTCGACLIRIVSGEFNPPTLAEYQKIPREEREAGVRLACQLWPRGPGELYLDNPAPASVWLALDEDGCDRWPGDPELSGGRYAVAVDLGTTHIRLSFWDRQSGRRIGTRIGVNPQIAVGADVLTRLDAESRDGADRPIGRLARDAVMDGIRDILSRDLGEITPILAQLGKAVIVGNTAMLTLICGGDGDNLYRPENWQRPIACQPNDLDAWRRDWRTPAADIRIVQPLAGFIGSDLLADVLATGITEQTEPMMLADFGTNTEIALWDGDRLTVTSVPGGPAFEGVGLRNGVSAEPGAIARVAKDEQGWQWQTLGDRPARGFCASGFIDAIALLLDAGLLKPSGRFAEAPPVEGFRLDPAVPRTAIFPGDIDAFQRAKASAAAAMAQLLADAGLELADLAALWICGSFGRHLDLHHAVRVGLLPALSAERTKIMANAGLAGCEQLLLDARGESRLQAVLARAGVVNLGDSPAYEARFIDHLRLCPMPN